GWRVPETTLLVLAFAGGSLGAWTAMTCFRHKTVKGKFRAVFWLLAALQIALVLLLIWKRCFLQVYQTPLIAVSLSANIGIELPSKVDIISRNSGRSRQMANVLPCWRSQLTKSANICAAVLDILFTFLKSNSTRRLLWPRLS